MSQYGISFRYAADAQLEEFQKQNDILTWHDRSKSLGNERFKPRQGTEQSFLHLVSTAQKPSSE